MALTRQNAYSMVRTDIAFKYHYLQIVIFALFNCRISGIKKDRICLFANSGTEIQTVRARHSFNHVHIVNGRSQGVDIFFLQL